MSIEQLMKEYRAIVIQEKELAAQKEALRAKILSELKTQRMQSSMTPYGSASQSIRFRLKPRREAILGLLQAEDILPFAHFTPKRVKELLVPKYGREQLLPLFEIEKFPQLLVKEP